MKKLNRHKQVILKVLRGVTSHPTADWVYEEVRKEIPNISLGTVYRNLNLLKGKEMVLKLDYSGTMSRFDGNPKPHPHIVCSACGKVEDISLDGDKRLLENATRLSGYKIQHYRLEFSGVCRECQSDRKEAVKIEN